MGCVCMKQRFKHEDPAALAAQTHFNKTEVEALYELFRKLSSSLVDDGFISKEEFHLGLFRNSKKQSLFANGVFQLFRLERQWGNRLRGVCAIFSFQTYNISQTGFIEIGEVNEMISALLEELHLILPDDIIEDIIDKTFEDADAKRDGKFDLEEWKEFVARNPSLLKNMTIPYFKDITTAFPDFVLRSDIEDDKESFI